MIIREAESKDIQAISRIARKTYAETFGDGISPEQLEYILESTRSEAYFRSVMGKDLIFVAVQYTRVVGYIQISDARYNVKEVEISEGNQAIHAIYVDSEYQSRGIGKALMDTAFRHPRITDAENVFIDVYEENTRALNFYRKYGFQPVGKVDVEVNGEVIGYDLVLMHQKR